MRMTLREDDMYARIRNERWKVISGNLSHAPIAMQFLTAGETKLRREAKENLAVNPKPQAWSGGAGRHSNEVSVALVIVPVPVPVVPDRKSTRLNSSH